MEQHGVGFAKIAAITTGVETAGLLTAAVFTGGVVLYVIGAVIGVACAASSYSWVSAVLVARKVNS